MIPKIAIVLGYKQHLDHTDLGLINAVVGKQEMDTGLLKRPVRQDLS